jgi:prevent-host-death family protein
LPFSAQFHAAIHVLHLCVMGSREWKPQRVGIRELRQNLSVYVRRVREEGRAYEVTERGEPVARLTPLEGRATSRIERMIADGRISPATRTWDELPPPIPLPPGGRPLSEILREMRDEDDR